jgi:hypothetical protein
VKSISYQDEGNLLMITGKVRLYHEVIRSESHGTHEHSLLKLKSASLSWCQAPIWDQQPIFLSPCDFLLDSCVFVIL